MARSAASRMSATRTRHSLGGTHSLTEDPLAMLLPDHPRGRQVDAAPEQLFELKLHVHEADVPDGLVELGNEVDVAVGPRLVARDRAEDQERADPEPAQILAMSAEKFDGFDATHRWIISSGPRGWKGPCRSAGSRVPGDPRRFRGLTRCPS